LGPGFFEDYKILGSCIIAAEHAAKTSAYSKNYGILERAN
jgi:hypothetical protein